MAETPAQHPTCVETTTVGDLPNRTYVCGEGCPRPAGPDPARDARVDAYRDRERRRAARALDRYFEVIIGDKVGGCGDAAVAGERFVEQVGDYVLARLGDDVWTSAHRAGLHADMWVEKCAMCLPGDDPRPLQQKSHYGVPFCPHGVPAGNIVTCVSCHPEDFRDAAPVDTEDGTVLP